MGRPLTDKYPAYLALWRQTGHRKRDAAYYHQLYIARPKWADMRGIRRIYREAEARRRNGEQVVVDHIVPLNHHYVCGLDCEDNLQIITYKENEAKSNYWWPDCWHDNLELPLPVVEPHQLTLNF